MTSVDSSEPRDESGGIALAAGPEGQFAFRPRQLIVRGDRARAVVRERFRISADQRDDDDDDGNFLITLPPGADVMSVAADLADDGFLAEPNYVLFAHDLKVNTMPGDSLGGSPLWGNPLWGNPLWGNPLWGNPLWGNPLWGNPLWGNPVGGDALYLDQYQMTNFRPSTARPAKQPDPKPIEWDPSKPRETPTVLILDSGLAGKDPSTGKTWLPQYLSFLETTPLIKPPLDTTPLADRDVPHMAPTANLKTNDFGALDPIAGHGTFVAGLIEMLVPGRDISVYHVVDPLGDTDAWTVEKAIQQLVDEKLVHDQTILNLSFGGHAADLKPGEMWPLARAVRKATDQGAVIVASAGNDATARKSYPACLRGVIGVAGLGPNGPAPFTNYGPWVRACAPGTNLVSTFFTGFNGPIDVGSPALDPDKFEGWARWSGTSFAAPVVVAALAREMKRTSCTALQAVERVIDAPGLLSLPGLGTVVNIV